MASLNEVFIMGNLTRDPELKYTTNGTALCHFGIAISSKYKTKEGEKKEDVVFVNGITAWGRLAEICGEYLQKGSPVFIKGRLNVSSWEDKESGKKMSQMRITAISMQMLGKKGDSTSDKPPKEEEQPQKTEDGGEESIPF